MSLSEAVLAAMRGTNELFDSRVIRQQDIQELDQVYTSDAHVLPPGAPMIVGREQIKSFWKQAITGLKLKSARLETVDAQQSGDNIFEIGKAELALEGGQTVSIKYVVLWKQEQGRWKWHVDIWNANQ